MITIGGASITGNTNITGTLGVSSSLTSGPLTCTTLAGTSGATYGGWQTYNSANGTLFGTPSTSNGMGIGSGTAFASSNIYIRCIGGSTGSIVCLAYSGLGCTLSAGASSFAASSDERLKNIITDNPYPNALDDIQKIISIRYRWKHEDSCGDHSNP